MSYYSDPDPKYSDRMRKRMIEEQLKGRGIWDNRVLSVFEKVKRHEFVSEALYHRAYDDNPLPIGKGQTISQPFIVGLMTQELLLSGTERVLEIGTGSGFQAAILSHLCRMVITVERIEQLYLQAKTRLLSQMGLRNIRLVLSDNLEYENMSQEKFDRIIITAASPAPPLKLLSCLGPGASLIAPIGDRASQVLYRITAFGEGVRPDGHTRDDYPGYYFRPLLDVRFVPLIGPGGWHE